MASTRNASGTPEEIYRSAMFHSSTDLLDHIKDGILTETSHQEFVYTRIPNDWAETVLEKLDEGFEGTPPRINYNSVTRTMWIRIIQTRILNCQQKWFKDEMGSWVAAGQLMWAEYDHLHFFVGEKINFFDDPYATSRKEPDFFVRPGSKYFPSLVIEAGWSESFKRLEDDTNLWFVGGEGQVNAIIIIKWEGVPNTNRVRGSVELYTPDSNNNRVPVLQQTEVIFPAPPQQQHQTQGIALTRRMLFNAAVFKGRDPDETFFLKLDVLRKAATDAMFHMGLVPA